MALTDLVTDTSSVGARIQNDIYLQSIIPLAYATPVVTMMDSEPLRKRGKTLQHQFLVPQSEFADASSYEYTTIATNNTIGVEEIQFGKKTFTVTKKVKSNIITDLAKYHDLGDIADDSGMALRDSAARTINSLVFDALLAGQGGLRFKREDGLASCQKSNVAVTAGSTVSSIAATSLTEANDFWIGAQVVFRSGQLIGQTFLVTDSVASTNLVIGTAMPYAPATGDLFDICQPGQTDDSTADVVVATPTIASVLTTAMYCRNDGATSPMAARGGGFTYDRAGIRRVVSPSIASGVVFLHNFLMDECMATVRDGDAKELWQSDEGFSRIVGGGLQRLGNMLWVPINHHKRRSAADGTLSNTAGALWPILVMFKGCALATRLRDAPGDNFGLVFRSKVPRPDDIANMYDSIKLQNEAYMHNAFGGKNSLHGAVHWCYTAIA